jgi:hypothetical protein
VNWDNENFYVQIIIIIDDFLRCSSKEFAFGTLFFSHLQDVIAHIDEKLIEYKRQSDSSFDHDLKDKIARFESYRESAQSTMLCISTMDVPESKIMSILKVCFLDENDDLKEQFKTQDYLKVRIEYSAKEKISDPAFGIAFHSEGGMLLAGPNTLNSGYDIGHIFGDGTVEFIISKLPFLPGKYYVSVAVHTKSSFTPIDFRNKLYCLRIEDGKKGDLPGIIFLDAKWQHHTTLVNTHKA